jgi:hypothetical protein
MPWKMDGESVVAQDGKPVLIHPDGREAPFDGDGALSTITRLNGENKTRREQYEALEAKFKPFENLTDADGNPLDGEKVRSALDTVKALSEKKLMEAGEVQKIKDEAVKSYQVEIDKLKNEKAAAQAEKDELVKGYAFASSPFVQDKLLLPADMAQKIFGDAFKVEGNAPVGYLGTDKILSREKIGEVAAFDEALQALVDRHPQKDRILKADGGGGSGAPSRSEDKKTAQASDNDPAALIAAGLGLA